MVPLEAADAAHEALAGAHVEGGEVEQRGHGADVGAGGEVQRLEVAVHRAQHLGVAVHDEDAVLGSERGVNNSRDKNYLDGLKYVYLQEVKL